MISWYHEIPLWLFWTYVAVGLLALYGLFSLTYNAVIVYKRKRAIQRRVDQIIREKCHDHKC